MADPLRPAARAAARAGRQSLVDTTVARHTGEPVHVLVHWLAARR